MLLLASSAQAACDEADLRALVTAPVAEAARRVDAAPEQGDGLVDDEVRDLLARCETDPALVAWLASCGDSDACAPDRITERAERLLRYGRARDWLGGEPVSAPGYALPLPQALHDGWRDGESSAAVDLIGYALLRITVRPGPPPPPPEPPERGRRSWEPPPVPLTEWVSEEPIVWTARCYGPDWLLGIAEALCQSVQIDPSPPWTAHTIAPGLTLVGPTPADTRGYRTVSWPAWGVQVSLWPGEVDAPTTYQRTLTTDVGPATIGCQPERPSAAPLAQQLCSAAPTP